MSGRQATVVAILSVILAACSAGVETTPSSPVSPGPSRSPTSLATVSSIPTAVVSSATPVATPTPTLAPTPTPTPRPTPSKPSGVRYESESFSICDTSGEGLCEVAGLKHSLRWKAPRTKDDQIRVYAVTECLSDDMYGATIDGWCLRDSTANDVYGTLIDGSPALNHSALPSSILVLLAKGPASKGKMTWESPVDLLGYVEGDTWNSGPKVYSIVVAAYDKAGHNSGFVIADSDHVCDLIESMECPEDSDWPPDDGG
jgi:hypothetical protein